MSTTSDEMGTSDTNGPQGLSISNSDTITLVIGLIGILIAFVALMHTVKCHQRLMKKVNQY